MIHYYPNSDRHTVTKNQKVRRVIWSFNFFHTTSPYPYSYIWMPGNPLLQISNQRGFSHSWVYQQIKVPFAKCRTPHFPSSALLRKLSSGAHSDVIQVSVFHRKGRAAILCQRTLVFLSYEKNNKKLLMKATDWIWSFKTD